ncbi:MAG: helix-turn-helix domain-containing protein, partial [Eubacteriales bacterium]|nr:helix-turn-helix domain-containing protein [Eubacteriales bacterium]
MEELKDKWFNIEAVAEYLSITEDTARTRVREGKLPEYRVGKRYKFKLS